MHYPKSQAELVENQIEPQKTFHAKIARWSRSFERVPWVTLFIGMVVRLFFMPFTAHSDLIHMYWIASRAAFGFEFTYRVQTVLIYFHAAYLKLVSFTIPYFRDVWVPSEEFRNFDFASLVDWYRFISHPEVYRVLFVFKLPYLLFDLVCAFLLLNLITDRNRARLAFRFWWLNPILIFATYIFGRHEPFAMSFIFLSLVLIKRGQINLGMLFLGAAIAIRYYALFLLPFYVLSLDLAWNKRLRYLAFGLAPWTFVGLISLMSPSVAEGTGFINDSGVNHLLAMRLPVAAWDNLYIFPLGYFLLLLHRFYNRGIGLRFVQQYGLMAMLLLFATASISQSPHYWTWFLPLLGIQIAQDRRLLPLHALQILMLLGYSFVGGRASAGYLFAPVAPDVFWNLPSPLEAVQRFVGPETVVSLARTGFTAVTAWMGLLVFQHMNTRNKPEGKNASYERNML